MVYYIVWILHTMCTYIGTLYYTLRVYVKGGPTSVTMMHLFN